MGPKVHVIAEPARRAKKPTAVEREVARLVQWGIAGTLGAPAMAFLAAMGAMASFTEEPTEAWRRLSASSTPDAIAMLGLYAGVCIPLFLATQIGDALARRRDAEMSAQAVILDNLTAIACMLSSIAAWLVVPAVVSKSDAYSGWLPAVAVPVLLTWLWAASVPSPDSRRLVLLRAVRTRARLDDLCAWYDSALRYPDGSLPKVVFDRAALRIQIFRTGMLGGSAAGILLVVLQWFVEPLGRVPSLMVLAAVSVTFASIFYGAVANAVTVRTARLVDGWISGLVARTPKLMLVFVGVVLTILAASLGSWVAALCVPVLLAGPVVFAWTLRHRRMVMSMEYRALIERRELAARSVVSARARQQRQVSEAGGASRKLSSRSSRTPTVTAPRKVR